MYIRLSNEDIWECHFVRRVNQKQNRTSGQGNTERLGTKGAHSGMTMMSEEKQ